MTCASAPIALALALQATPALAQRSTGEPPRQSAAPIPPLSAGVAPTASISTPPRAQGPSPTSTPQLLTRGNTTVPSFAHARAHLAVLYSERPRTLYSDCVFDEEKVVDYDQCHYRPRFGGPRAHRIEWEHVVPAEAFGQAFACWREGHPSCIDTHGRAFRGRRCAQRASSQYRRMEADLYNLYPEIGELNQMRSNKPMGEPVQQRRELAPLLATFVGSDAFMPRPEVRGDVARTYRYMHDSYPGCGILGRKRERTLAAWDAMDPVDAWECRRAWRIEAIQGNENLFVKRPCVEAGLWPSD